MERVTARKQARKPLRTKGLQSALFPPMKIGGPIEMCRERSCGLLIHRKKRRPPRRFPNPHPLSPLSCRPVHRVGQYLPDR